MDHSDVLNVERFGDPSYEAEVVAPLSRRLEDVLAAFHGDMYEAGMGGYPGSSQSLNIDNFYARMADELAHYALELFDREGFGFWESGE